MPPPSSAPAQHVWIGRYTDDAADGWLEALDVVQTTDLGVFERKVTTGDFTKSSDDYISEWILSDLSGGIGIATMNEGADSARSWFSIATTWSTTALALPPKVTQTRPSGITGATNVYPLGDVFDSTTGRVQTHYVAFTVTSPGSGIIPYGYNETTDGWYSAATALTSAPVNKGVAFRGTGSNTLLFIPRGSLGYSTIRETAAGTAVVANAVASGTTIPGVQDFCRFDNRLYALATDGKLWSTLDGSTWSIAKDATGTIDVQLDQSTRPRHLRSFFNRTGEPTLCVVSDQDVQFYNQTTGTLQVTAVQYPPHPDFGLGAEVWRAGEDLWVTAGLDAVRFTTANVVVPLSGLARDDGVPQLYRGAMVDVQGELSALYALVRGDSAADASETFVEDGGTYADEATYLPDAAAFAALVLWTGQGWHGVWASSAPTTPTWMTLSKVPSGYRLWWGLADGYVYTMPLDPSFLNPKQAYDLGTQQWAETGYIETGQFDANMLGFDKLASHVSLFCHYASADDRVEVQYQTNADSINFWHDLGAATAIDETILHFDPDDNDTNRGVPFNWIAFRINFLRGTTATNTPLLKALLMHYTKIPQSTASHTVVVSLSPSKFNGMGPTEMADRLSDLLEAREFLVFVNGDKTYRGRLAGISGTTQTGMDRSGQLTVSFLELKESA